MKRNNVDLSKRFFDPSVTDRERAVFEGGIALATISHQFTGVPVNKDKKILRILEEAIESTIELQPYKSNIKVKIDPKKIAIKKEKSPTLFAYKTLKNEYMDVKAKSTYGKVTAHLRMRYIPEIDYTLMYIERICTTHK